MLNQVPKLSRAEQLALMASIVYCLSKEEDEALTDVALAQAVVEDDPVITKGDKTIDPTSLFGIWKDNPRTLEEIRQKAWRHI